MGRKPAYTASRQLKDIKRIIRFKSLPYNPFRSGLYTVEELMEGYDPDVPGKSLDEIIADHFNRDKKMPRVHEALAQRIHDQAIDQALYRFAQREPHQRRRITESENTSRTASAKTVCWPSRRMESFSLPARLEPYRKFFRMPRTTATGVSTHALR